MKTQSIKETSAKIIKDLEEYTEKMRNWPQVEENYEGIRVNCTYEDGKG